MRISGSLLFISPPLLALTEALAPIPLIKTITKHETTTKYTTKTVLTDTHTIICNCPTCTLSCIPRTSTVQATNTITATVTTPTATFICNCPTCVPGSLTVTKTITSGGGRACPMPPYCPEKVTQAIACPPCMPGPTYTVTVSK